MVAIIAVVAAGTIFESVYSTAYAKLAIYDTVWFTALMVLLWINILFAALSRWPWRRHHAGFVVTHLGMLIMLAGGFITGYMGIDGTLQIPEGQENGTVVLPGLSLAYQLEGSPSAQSVKFKRTLSERDPSGLTSVNSALEHVLAVERFVPFAQIDRTYASSGQGNGPLSISFILKSQFFNVSEWLHTTDRPEMQMGPATLRLVEGRYRAVRTTSPSARRPADRPERLIILERAGGRELKAATLSELKVGIVVDGIRVRLTNRFRHAVVTDNKIGEDPTGGGPPNPALELNLEKAGQAQRDVVYAKYPEFSLNKAGSFGLAFRYEAPDLIQMNSNGVSAANATTGNTIQFHFERGQPKTVQVVLLKNGVFVAEKIMSEGDAFTTPWMGMTIFLGSIIQGSESVTKITPVKPKPGSELPPSAVLVRTSGSQKPFWLALGERAPAQIGGRAAFVAFQNEMIELPFKLTLEKFSKVDYPGTQTAMSYESRVRLSRDGSVHTISMNEPLKEAGYTLYQASYMLSPDSPPVTVLSVNRDPGRPIKYAGSVILSIGIVMFTLMRSRVMRARQRTEAK